MREMTPRMACDDRSRSARVAVRLAWALPLVVATTSLALGQDGAAAAAPDPELTKAEVEELQTSLNYLWVLVAAALVLFMQAGFMCLESGLARRRNSINVAIKNMADLVIAVAGFGAIGFGLMFGMTQSGWFGTTDFFLDLNSDPWLAIFFLFQAAFCGTAATIDSGVVAGRASFSAYLFISFIVSAIIYPIAGHWAWGSLFHSDSQGWLEAKGFIDFAGSTVVHSVGAWVGLAAGILIGPRLGKFDENGKPRHFPAGDMQKAYLGVFVLFFGWFGFNCGSTLEATGDVAIIAVNTMVSASFGGVTAGLISALRSPGKKPQAEMIANGVLGGLVGITAGCASVDTTGAVLIGLTSGVVVYVGCFLMDHVFKVDDVVMAIPVHGFCGAWGTVALALFMPAANLPEGSSRLDVIGVQCLGVGAFFVWSFGTAFILIKGLTMVAEVRVSTEAETIGLNQAEHGHVSSIFDHTEAERREKRETVSAGT